jgi:alginate O-acetyltransferase complex protein AlgJ
MSKTFSQKLFEIILIVFFLAVIASPPLTFILFSKKGWSDTENRVLAPFPGVPAGLETLRTFPEKFEAYYNDHFGFREILIERYHREMKKRFGKSGIPNVIAGKEGWYFWSGSGLNDDFRGLTPMTEQQLDTWSKGLARKREWLAKKGIRYLFVFVPDKQTIYPEYLPDTLQKTKGITRIEQMTEYLKGQPDAGILDLRPGLLTAKSGRQLYQKTDTHWNEYGAFVAYREMIHQISQWFPKERFKLDFDFEDGMKECPSGDLARMLGLKETVKEMRPILKQRPSRARSAELPIEIENVHKEKQTEPFMKECKDAHLRVLVFRDSFFEMLHPFLSENFRQTVYLWQFYDQKTAERLIDTFHPDLVIEERVERLCFKEVQEEQR